ncbi:DUF447 family protein [Methanogenium organophilum]|uniref:DUF447 family protein n=1 Tax=Methanogenium organophilum TaxID=2199 RepID=A0A9X9S730_METOG|nr:DUF447 family protein [Methanogenium organophilum]
MGILADGINEVIATTVNPETGIPNAAPMGIIARRGRTMMQLFHGTHTEANIRASGWVVANLTFDPMVYVESAFGDLPDEAFTEISTKILTEGVDIPVTMQRLSVGEGCEAWEAFTTTIVSDNPKTLVVELTPVASEILDLQPHPPNRAFAGIIEATVHATRYVMTRDPELWALIEQSAEIVRKCGGEEHVAALEVLIAFCQE